MDASALLAIIAEEPEGPQLAERLDRVRQAFTSPIALYEANLALVRVLKLSMADAQSVISEFLQRTRAGCFYVRA